MDLSCAVSLPRGIALRWMVILSSTGFTGCGNSASFHSERSEESLPIENKRPRGILRAKSALRMTVFRFFPQPVKPVLLERPVLERGFAFCSARPAWWTGLCLNPRCRPEGRRYKCVPRVRCHTNTEDSCTEGGCDAARRHSRVGLSSPREKLG